MNSGQHEVPDLFRATNYLHDLARPRIIDQDPHLSGENET